MESDGLRRAERARTNNALLDTFQAAHDPGPTPRDIERQGKQHCRPVYRCGCRCIGHRKRFDVRFRERNTLAADLLGRAVVTARRNQCDRRAREGILYPVMSDGRSRKTGSRRLPSRGEASARKRMRRRSDICRSRNWRHPVMDRRGKEPLRDA